MNKNEPKVVALEKGKEYYYCRCGKSEDGIFCNGSHKGTSFEPKAFRVEESKDYYLCACKKNGGEPFCNGSHKN